MLRFNVLFHSDEIAPKPEDYNLDAGFIYHQLPTTKGMFYYKEHFEGDRISAKQTCQNLNSNLPIPKNWQQNNFFSNFFDPPFWLGISRDLGDDGNIYNNFRGDDGYIFLSYRWKGWADGEPNNKDGDEDGVEMIENGYWNDENESIILNFYCVFVIPN